MTIGDRIAVAALVTALAAVGIGAWLAFGASGSLEPTGDSLLDPFAEASTSFDPIQPETVVVDVEGAVMRPGIIELTAGSRVADAIQAAGGYAPDADLAAAAAGVNLAEVVRDGQQILVPLIGAAPGGGGGLDNGLVDLNSASAEALDALPGIGPVTVQKIVAARTEQPFRTLEELVTRQVLTNSQLTKIRGLVSLG